MSPMGISSVHSQTRLEPVKRMKRMETTHLEEEDDAGGASILPPQLQQLQQHPSINNLCSTSEAFSIADSLKASFFFIPPPLQKSILHPCRELDCVRSYRPKTLSVCLSVRPPTVLAASCLSVSLCVCTAESTFLPSYMTYVAKLTSLVQPWLYINAERFYSCHVSL